MNNDPPISSDALHGISSTRGHEACGSRFASWKFAGAVLAVLALWIAARAVFFEGLCGSDDLEHVAYVQRFDHIPSNHWETRIFYNFLLYEAVSWLGMSTFAYALPSLVGSLMILVATMAAGFQAQGIRGLLICGMLVGTLPIDVVFSTAPFANALSAGFAAVGTAVFLAGSGIRWSLLASVFLGLGVLSHPTCIFYILALCVAFFLFGDGRRLTATACGVASIVIYFALEFTIFACLTGNPLYEMTLLNHLTDGVTDPNFQLFSRGWFLFPLITFVFCKEFGITILLTALAAIFFRRKLHRDHICLAVACILFWIWIGYGSRKPTAYEPFWRLPRFQYPLAMPVCVVIGSSISSLRRWVAVPTGVIVFLNLMLLSVSGSWGQGIKISNEFLSYVRNHETTRFVTDKNTFRELAILNGGRSPTNVTRWDSTAQKTPQIVGRVFLLNPLNAKTPPTDFALGKVEFQTQPHWRMLAYILPARFIRDHSWWTRRPSGTAMVIEDQRDVPTVPKTSS